MASTIGGFLGGKAHDLGWALERSSNFLSDRFSGQSPEWCKEHEAAFDEAQNEVRPHFCKCPSCGHENPPGMKFCGECGTKL